MGADLGQLASSEVWRGLWRRGEATMNECVEGDQGGQQLILTQRETERRLLFSQTPTQSTPEQAEIR